MMKNMHDYLNQDDSEEIILYEEEFPPLPETPCKSPAIKQRKTEGTDMNAVLSQLGELSRLINNRSDALEKMIGENARVIASMKESINENTRQISGLKDVIDFTSAEVKDLKVKSVATESLAKKKSSLTHRNRRGDFCTLRLIHVDGIFESMESPKLSGKMSEVKSLISVSSFSQTRRANFRIPWIPFIAWVASGWAITSPEG